MEEKITYRRLIVSFLFGVVIAILLIAPQKNFQRTIYKTEYDTIHTVDTIVQFVDRRVPILVTDTIEVPTIVYIDSTGLKTYSDTSFIEDNFYLYYNAKVNGFLNDITLSYYDNRPTKITTVFDNKTITKNNYISPNGLYVGLQAGFSNLSPSVYYLRNRSMYGLSYNFTLSNINVMYAIKVLPK